jgi:FAD/FMN-containing dehydrogenase
LLETLGAAAEAGIIRDAVLAKNEADAEAFWAIRDGISEAERVQGPALQHDVSVPVDCMPDYIVAAEAHMAIAFPGARVLAFGHLGDGNVHHHVKPPLDSDQAGWIAEQGEAASREIYGLVQSYGGSLSAEHGIGASKAYLLPDFIDPPRLAAMRMIKSALDPKNILNPGKIFAQ